MEKPSCPGPLLKMGQHSYEIYLTHVFVVLALFDLFLDADKPMRWVPILFILTVLISVLLGAAVAKFYSEPMNRFLRGYRRGGSQRAASVPGERETAATEA